MFKSNAISLLFPFNKSTPAPASSPRITVAPLVFNRGSATSNVLTGSFSFLPIVSLFAVIGLSALVVLHVFWINTYSAKGFELKKVQTSIEEQTSLQKKLLVQQSLLNSSVNLVQTPQSSLVPVSDVEYISGNSVAQAQ